MTHETDELVDEARGGGDAAYEALFARVARRLLVYVRLRLGARLGNTVEAMDVVQETYLEAHRAFARFEPRGPGSFSRWLLQIADNRLRDLAGHYGAAKRQALQEAARGSEVLTRLRAEVDGPSTEAAEREAHAALVDALLQLEEQEREAVVLRFFHGLTLEACAEALATSEPSVRRLLTRGQIKLGSRLRRLS